MDINKYARVDLTPPVSGGMIRGMDKLRAMQTFVQIVGDGSLTAAAQSLDSSLPAVVRTLAALEEHLGVRLLNRTTRRISMTEEGKIYLDSCRRILSEVEEAEGALIAQQAEPSGALSVTAPVLFGQMYVAPAITSFVRRYEKVHCRAVFVDHVVNLLEEGIDVGVRIGHLADSSLVARQVADVRLVVVASPAYLRKHGSPKHPNDLLKANCVQFTAFSSQGWTFHEGPRKFSVPVSGNLEFNQVAAAIEACAQGMGFGTFISYQVAPYVAQKRLRIVLENFEPLPRPISIVYPHARLLPSRTRVFIDWMKDHLTAAL